MIAAFLFRFWKYIAIALLSAGLYWQIKANGHKSAEIDTLNGLVKSQNGTIELLQSEAQFQEVLLVAHAGKRETIIEQKEVVKTRIREVIRNAPDNDCAVTVASPVILDCLRFDACEATDN